MAFVEYVNPDFESRIDSVTNRMTQLLTYRPDRPSPTVHQPMPECDFFEDEFSRGNFQVSTHRLTSRQHIISAMSALQYSYNQRLQDHEHFLESMSLLWYSPDQYDSKCLIKRKAKT